MPHIATETRGDRSATQALVESEARLNRIAANIPGGMIYQFLLQPDGTVVMPYVSPSCRDIYEVEPEEIRRNPSLILDMMQPEDREVFSQSVAASAQNLTPWRWEGRIVTPSGALKWLQGGSRPERQANGDILWDGLLMDMSENRRIEVTLQESEQRFRTLNTFAPIGIYQTDANGRCVYINERGREITGLTLAESLDLGWRQVIHPDDYDTVFFEWERKAREGQEFSAEFRIRTPQGKGCWVQSRAKALRANDGTLLGHVGTLEDITGRKQADAQLRQAKELAEEANQLKSNFVSFVAHQLRTPLTGMKWLIELASLEPDVSEGVGLHLEGAQQEVERLILLVNDLLDLLKLESGTLNANLQDTCLVHITQDVLREVQPLIQEKAHRFSLSGPESLSIKTDPHLLRQVMMHLVTNAVTYTPPAGAIEIQIDAGGTVVRWTISDTGIGIPLQDQAFLFQKFHRASNVGVVETEGHGLGLCLSRLMMEGLGGTIGFASEEGKGSRFTLTIPQSD